MKVRCRNCSREYVFEDSKIPEEGLTYKCPKCGNVIVFSLQPETETAPLETGKNPIVQGSYAGAFGGLGCALPSIVMTLLGIGFLSLGMEISGYSAAGAVLMALLKMLSTGVLIGISLAFIGAKTEIPAWSFWGVLIGAFMGGAIGLASGLFFGTVMGGVFGAAVVFASVLGWTLKAALVSGVVILIRNFALASDEEGTISAPLTSRQMVAVGGLFFLMIFTMVMEMKGHSYARNALQEVKKEMSAEGLTIKGQEQAPDAQGDLVVKGVVANDSDEDKMGWIIVAELRDENSAVLRKETLMNGIQLHSMEDMAILRKRGQQVPRPNATSARSALIKKGESVPFEISFPEPPKEYKTVELTLRNVDEASMRELLTQRLQEIRDRKGQETGVK